MIQKNDLFDYTNRYIYQDSKYFKFSIDSILLAEYTTHKLYNKNILDMCAGNMASSLILSKYTDSKIIGFEIQKEIYELGIKSIKCNNLENNLKLINDDVNNIGKYFAKEYFDVMMCNPPYFKYNDSSLINKNDILSIARHEIKLTLEDVFSIANKYLKNNGFLYIVHRTNRLDEIINLGYKYHLNIKNIQLVTTKLNKEPEILLIKAVKNSKSGVKIAKEICIAGLDTYQNIFSES